MLLLLQWCCCCCNGVVVVVEMLMLIQQSRTGIRKITFKSHSPKLEKDVIKASARDEIVGARLFFFKKSGPFPASFYLFLSFQ